MNIVNEIEVIMKGVKTTKEFWDDSNLNSRLEIYHELSKIIENYSILSKDEKIAVNKSIEKNDYSSINITVLLYNFAKTMANYCLRFPEQQKFTNGLRALSMIFDDIDTRDIWVVMPLFCDLSKRKNFSFDEILAQKDEFAELVQDFINRDEKDKTLECMGYMLTTDENNNPIYKKNR